MPLIPLSSVQFLMSTCNPILNKPKPKPKEEPPKEEKDAAVATETGDQSKAAGNEETKDATEGKDAKDASANATTPDQEKDSKAEMDLD